MSSFAYNPFTDNLDYRRGGGGPSSGITITGDSGGPISSTTFGLQGQDGVKVDGSGTTFTITPRGIGIRNMYLGQSSGNLTNTANDNYGYGAGSLNNVTTGSNNVAIGSLSLTDLESGENNICIGTQAGNSIIDASSNVVIGVNAFLLGNSFENVAIGTSALGNITSNSNCTAVGWSCLTNCTGQSNTAVGHKSGFAISTGQFNTCLGTETISQNAVSFTGSNNIAIGNHSGYAYVGSESGNIVIGNDGLIGEDDTIRIGKDQTTAYMAGISGVTVSNEAPVVINTVTGQLGVGSGGGGGGTIFTKFTASGTFTKNVNTKWIEIIAWGGGSGGGSGSKYPALGGSSGGGGGVGSGTLYYYGPTEFFDTSEVVTIGTGGAGGASVTTDSTDGNNGAQGTETTLGNLSTYSSIYTNGGGGTIFTGGSAGAGTFTIFPQGQGLTNFRGGDGGAGFGAVPGDNYPREAPLTQPFVGGSGGGGGGLDPITGIGESGARGGNFITMALSPAIILAGGTGGIYGGSVNGGNGNIPAITGGMFTGGTGGGGGAASISGPAGNGGNGAAPGGPGGGGGGSIDGPGNNSGAGGNGARGELWVIEYT